MTRWNKARVVGVAFELPGLKKRRAAECDVCLSGLPVAAARGPL